MDLLQQQRLTHLKNKGFNPKFILDIGAGVGEWSLMAKSVFKDAEYFLIEANKDNEASLLYSGFNYKLVLLGDKENEEGIEFHKINSGYNTGNSIFIEQTRHYTGNNFNTVKLPMTTLDKVLSNRNNKYPDLIKMDVQGAELMILDGAQETLKQNAEFILLETQILEYNKFAPMLNDVIGYMNDINYQTYDILGNHYLPSGDLMQLDVLFVKKGSQFIKRGLLD